MKKLAQVSFRMLFLCEWKSKHNAAAVARNINAAFGSVNECTIQHWYAKFETGDESRAQN